MDSPNIIFLIWDACRRSDLLDINGVFANLTKDNITCRRAIAPSAWSLPSHVSFFTGNHPSEHGVCTKHTNSIPELDALTDLQEAGYRTYGVSSNGYFSPEFGFDTQFDEFEFTIEKSSISVSEFIRRADERNLTGLSRYFFMITEALREESPVANMANLSLGALKLVTRGTPLHPSLETSNGYRYSARWNTSLIQDILDKHRDSQQPFMIGANYMDAHFPYYPRESFSLLDELRNFRRYHELNEQTGHQFRFLESLASDSVEEDNISEINNIYREEVRTLDDHLEEITTLLDKYGLAEDTLLIVTADHGEILGEEDELGRRRMGHPDSINDFHLTVPLLIANPTLDDRSITEPVETRTIADVLRLASLETGSIVEALTSTSGAVVESPAHKEVEVENRYPDLPKEFVQEYLYEHFVVGYDKNHKIIQSTNGMEHAWIEGETVPPDEVSKEMIGRCKSHLSSLKTTEPLDEVPGGSSVSDSAREQLKDLGYM